jgi:hypothetical protein
MEKIIVGKCNELAIKLYRAMGYKVNKEYKLYRATHPQEIGVWNAAVIAYAHIEGTDVIDCLNNMDDEEN